jgi:glycosyltransferase involved in cell wall biosynthesis
LKKGLRYLSRKDPIFKLWHINGSLESYSDRQFLLTFHELDALTQSEINILKNNDKVLVSSPYSVKVFNEHGVGNTSYLPLFFDAKNFKATNKTYFNDGRVTFNLCGKFEKRKHHVKAIRAWVNKYANNSNYSLQCALYNSFISQEDNTKLINMAVEGKKFFNVSFFGHMAQTNLYNEFLNSADVILGASGGEGWALPEFQSVAIGKHSVIVNAHAYTAWANDKNSVMLEASGKTPAYDNMFFHEGQEFNQGNIFEWSEDAFIEGCEKAIARVKRSKVNQEGLKLQEQFTVKKTTEQILSLF